MYYEDPELDSRDETRTKKEKEDNMYKRMACTIMEAEEIKADPDLMKKVEPYLDIKVRALTSIQDLKDEYDASKMREQRAYK
jgi:hypothetical protein